MKAEMKKRIYSKPEVTSSRTIERAALTCSGTFSNSQYDYKSSYYACGFNDS